MQLLPVQTLQGFQPHVQNRLGLHVVQSEPGHQVLFGVVVGLPDDLDDLVNVVLGDQQSLQQMGPFQRLVQIITGPAEDDLLLEGDVLVQNVAQGENLRLRLVVHQRQHIDGKGGLELGLGKQTVQDHLRVCVLLQLDDDAHAVPVGLVPQVADALQTLVLHLLGHIFDEHPLVHLIGQLSDDNAGSVLAELLEFIPCPDDDLAPAGGVGRPDACTAHNNAPCGEVRALHMLHQVRERCLRVVQHADGGVDDLPQVVGRDICGHAHGDAGGAVDQQVGEPAGEHSRLLPALVEVGVPVHRVLLNISQHLVGNAGEPGLGVTVGGGRVSVHGAEVAVSVHQTVPHGEVLSQTHHGIVDRGVSVGVVPAQHVAHAGGGLLKGAVMGQIVLIHGVEDAAVDRLQAVPHVGERTAHNDAHGVLNVGFLHLRHKGRGDDMLFRIADLFRIVTGFFSHNVLRSV